MSVEQNRQVNSKEPKRMPPRVSYCVGCGTKLTYVFRPKTRCEACAIGHRRKQKREYMRSWRARQKAASHA